MSSASKRSVTVSSLKFEAPITITVSGPLAAVIRFTAYLDEITPEAVALRAIQNSSVCDLTSSFGITDGKAEEFLGVTK